MDLFQALKFNPISWNLSRLVVANCSILWMRLFKTDRYHARGVVV